MRINHDKLGSHLPNTKTQKDPIKQSNDITCPVPRFIVQLLTEIHSSKQKFVVSRAGNAKY